jgi:hypothetical protein
MSTGLKVFPQVTVGTSAVQICTAAMITDQGNGIVHPLQSLSIQADPSNTGTIYVGAWLPAVTTTTYSRELQPGDWYSIAGSSIDGCRIGLIASASGQVAHISAT